MPVPEGVHPILGNHELLELTAGPIKNGLALNALFRQGLNTAYGDRGAAVYAAYQEPLRQASAWRVRSPNRVFLCHTIPDGDDLDAFDLGVLALDAWPTDAMKRHGTVYAMTWGRDTAAETIDRFAEMVDADWFVTGHQPCDDGFRLANHRQIIIDGTDPIPPRASSRGPVDAESLLKGIRFLRRLRRDRPRLQRRRPSRDLDRVVGRFEVVDERRYVADADEVRLVTLIRYRPWPIVERCRIERAAPQISFAQNPPGGCTEPPGRPAIRN